VKVKLLIYSILLIALTASISYFAIKGLPKLNTKNISRNNNIRELSAEELERKKNWASVLKDPTYLGCIQSQKNMEAKANELLPLHKMVLTKRTNDEPITKQDEYVSYLYGFLSKRAEDYKKEGFYEQDRDNDNIPDIREINDKTNLLKYIYCPDISKITTPPTSETCVEMTRTWMRPFETPVLQKSEYALEEEYELALKRYESDKDASVQRQKDCCYGTTESGSSGICAKVRSFMN